MRRASVLLPRSVAHRASKAQHVHGRRALHAARLPQGRNAGGVSDASHETAAVTAASPAHGVRGAPAGGHRHRRCDKTAAKATRGRPLATLVARRKRIGSAHRATVTVVHRRLLAKRRRESRERLRPGTLRGRTMRDLASHLPREWRLASRLSCPQPRREQTSATGREGSGASWKQPHPRCAWHLHHFGLPPCARSLLIRRLVGHHQSTLMACSLTSSQTTTTRRVSATSLTLTRLQLLSEVETPAQLR